MGEKPLYDSALFWVALTAMAVVVAVTFIPLGIAQAATAHATDLWGNWLFRIGIGAAVLAFLMLDWAVVLFLAHHQADRKITRPMQAALSAPTHAEVRQTLAPPEQLGSTPPPVGLPPPREPCKLSPGELARLFSQGATELQAQSLVETYIGKWREVSGTVSDVKQHNQYMIGVTATDPDKVTLTLFFDPIQWGERLRGLMSGDSVKAAGNVTGVSQGHVLFRDCEIAD